MSRIQLTDEQARIYASADDFVEVCDSEGQVVGKILSPALKEVVAECKRRLQTPGPRVSGEQVLEMLRTLDERWAKEGPFGKERLREIVSEVRAARATT